MFVPKNSESCLLKCRPEFIEDEKDQKYISQCLKMNAQVKYSDKSKPKNQLNISRRRTPSIPQGTWMLTGPTVPLQTWDDALCSLPNGNSQFTN